MWAILALFHPKSVVELSVAFELELILLSALPWASELPFAAAELTEPLEPELVPSAADQAALSAEAVESAVASQRKVEVLEAVSNLAAPSLVARKDNMPGALAEGPPCPGSSVALEHQRLVPLGRIGKHRRKVPALRACMLHARLHCWPQSPYGEPCKLP